MGLATFTGPVALAMYVGGIVFEGPPPRNAKEEGRGRPRPQTKCLECWWFAGYAPAPSYHIWVVGTGGRTRGPLDCWNFMHTLSLIGPAVEVQYISTAFVTFKRTFMAGSG